MKIHNFIRITLCCLKTDRSAIKNRTDKQLIDQQQKEMLYWRDVLKRVAAVVKALTSRGLAFRGHDEHFGSHTNGNYSMVLQLIAEFDPFLAEHIKRYGNAGSEKVNPCPRQLAMSSLLSWQRKCSKLLPMT